MERLYFILRRMAQAKNIPFSQEIAQWLESKQAKNLGSLIDMFKQKSFALIFLLMLSIPALPITTGGITHVLLLPISFVAALQMIFGRHSLWLPQRFRKLSLKGRVLRSALPFMVKRIRWFEKYSRPRLSDLLEHPITRSVLGFMVLLCTLGAFFAVPFSGLDTLPALGGVIIALGILLEDVVLALLGIVVGMVGIGLIIGAGTAVTTLFQHYF